MRKYDLITPEGTKDFLFEECLVRREIEQDLHDLFRSKGYSELTTPGLEFFDVFQSESGHYPQERLYKLTDSKGRLLVLRPESTMPIARVAATRRCVSAITRPCIALNLHSRAEVTRSRRQALNCSALLLTWRMWK